MCQEKLILSNTLNLNVYYINLLYHFLIVFLVFMVMVFIFSGFRLFKLTESRDTMQPPAENLAYFLRKLAVNPPHRRHSEVLIILFKLTKKSSSPATNFLLIKTISRYFSTACHE